MLIWFKILYLYIIYAFFGCNLYWWIGDSVSDGDGDGDSDRADNTDQFYKIGFNCLVKCQLELDCSEGSILIIHFMWFYSKTYITQR